MPVCLDILLKVKEITIPHISDNVYEFFNTLTEEQPENIKSILVSILRSNPDSVAKVFRSKRATYATWTKKASPRTAFWCPKKYQLLQHDLGHETAWAIIAAKLISIARCTRGRDRDFIDYSAQYLLDFVPPPRVQKKCKKCCKTGSVEEGIQYASRSGIPKRVDCDYVGCRDEPKASNARRFDVIGKMTRMSLTDALDCIESQPVRARLHLFWPDDEDAENEIYRGPRDWESKYMGLYDVMVYGTKIVEDELVAFVKLPCASYVNLKVSLDVELIQVPKKRKIQSANPKMTIFHQIFNIFLEYFEGHISNKKYYRNKGNFRRNLVG